MVISSKTTESNFPSSNLLEGLSNVLSYPSNNDYSDLQTNLDFIEEYCNLTEEPSKAFQELSSLAKDLKSASKEFPDTLAMQLEYTRLFIGSLKMLAPPYASYYVEPGGLLYGKTAAEVESLYKEFGLTVDDSNQMPADYLRYLLAFSSLLIGQYETSNNPVFLDAYNEFVDAYILSWLSECIQLVKKHEEYCYYSRLLELINCLL